jgi:hypothetical protein
MNIDKISIMRSIIGGKLRKIYYMALPEDEADYRKSQRRYSLGEAASLTTTQLAGGTFFASLLLFLQFPDYQIGMILALGNLATIFQVFTMSKVERMSKRKPFVCTCVLAKLFFGLVFLLPVLSLPTILTKMLVVIFYTTAYIGLQVSQSASQDWITRLVPIGIRGYYFAKKDALSVAMCSSITLVMGFLLDWFKVGREELGYNCIGTTIIALISVNFISFSKMKEDRSTKLNRDGYELHGGLLRKTIQLQENYEKPISFFTEIKLSTNSSLFRKQLVLGLLWITAFQSAMPFNASYQIKELGLSFSYLMIIGFLTSIFRVIISPRIGRLGDKYGMARTLKYAFGGLLLHHFFMVFITEANAFIGVGLACVCSAYAWSFVGTGLFNIQLNMISEENRTTQLSIISVITGIWGFAVTIISGKLLDVLQKVPIIIAHQEIYAQQLLNLYAALCYLIVIIYIYKVIQPIEERGYQLKEIYIIK